MPPKLNIAARYAQVEPDFIDEIKKIWKARWSALNDEIKFQPPRFRPMKASANAPVMSRLKALCTDRLALDKELTRLRGLPYERFFTRQYRDLNWMVGLTRPVVMTDDTRRWQAPRYFVYIPDNVVSRGTDAAFHFVPEGYEMTTARHPHHKARTQQWGQSGDIENIDYSRAADPLDYQPSTCWGSFGAIATSCIKSGDMVDLFRNIAIYLTRVNMKSLLVHPFEACHFLVDIGPAAAEKTPAITRNTRFYDR